VFDAYEFVRANVNEHGERVNEGISEMLHRGQYREWRRLMAQDA